MRLSARLGHRLLAKFGRIPYAMVHQGSVACPTLSALRLTNTGRPACRIGNLGFGPGDATQVSHRILVADDHAGTRAIIRQLIESAGEDWVVCCEAAGGRAAVQQALKEKPDLAILDVRMPDLDGMQTGREIRRRVPETPILIYSLLATPRLEVEAQESGFRAVVAKPDSAGLLAAMRKILGSKASGGNAPNPSQQREEPSKRPSPPPVPQDQDRGSGPPSNVS
jgi:DNA-binding NarL/FixJ family response regulator